MSKPQMTYEEWLSCKVCGQNHGYKTHLEVELGAHDIESPEGIDILLKCISEMADKDSPDTASVPYVMDLLRVAHAVIWSLSDREERPPTPPGRPLTAREWVEVMGCATPIITHEGNLDFEAMRRERLKWIEDVQTRYPDWPQPMYDDWKISAQKLFDDLEVAQKLEVSQ